MGVMQLDYNNGKFDGEYLQRTLSFLLLSFAWRPEWGRWVDGRMMDLLSDQSLRDVPFQPRGTSRALQRNPSNE